jgi:hypothetical protein
MTEPTIIHCRKHDIDFNALDGCPKCLEEKEAERAAAETDLATTNIVKVRYFSETTGQASGREYSYFTEEPLTVGTVVMVPVRERKQKAVVTAIDVPVVEIATFRDQVKTIPAGSIMPDAQVPTVEVGGKIEDVGTALQPPLVTTEEPVLEEEPGPYAPGANDGEINDEGLAEEEVSFEALDQATDHIPPALVTIQNQVGKPAPELLTLYKEAAGLLQFAKTRVIATNEDLKPATDDLAIILTCRKAMEARRKEIVGPIREKLDLVNSCFNDLMYPVLEADRLTKDQVAKFDQEQRAKAAEAKRIEDEKLKLAQDEMNLKGEHTQELGTAEAPHVQEVTRTNMGTLGGRANWKARVVDFKLLPDEYKLPNESLLNAYARTHKGEGEIPGVEFYDDRIYSVRTKSN